MRYIKTEKGQQVLKDRSVPLTPRQRSAFILFDGKNTVDQVMAATASIGITADDVQQLVSLGLLAVSPGPGGSGVAAPAVVAPAQPVPGTAATSLVTDNPASATAAGASSQRSHQQRYQDAYPIAAKLTASMGLRGFRLNLAVEGAGSYEQLCDLAPKIREAVGADKFAPLEDALYR
jgi:hypothetical protein